MTFGRVTGNNAVTWNPGKYDWYETVKLNYGYNFMAGLPALRLLPGWTSPKQHVPKTWRIMDDILSFWQSLGIGGFRCDMAQMIPMAFWKWAISRSRVRLPDVFFMAEAYNDHMKPHPAIRAPPFWMPDLMPFTIPTAIIWRSICTRKITGPMTSTGFSEAIPYT